MEVRNIEGFFLNTLLRICIAGVALIIASNLLLFPDDTMTIILASAVLLGCVVAYWIRERRPTTAVVILTSITMAAMCYQRITAPNTTTTLAIVMIVGFVYSVMLKGRIMWIMHGITFITINSVFVYYLPDAITAAITYSILYFVISFATGVFKNSYDRINQHLRLTNEELKAKAIEIASQNEELFKTQESLSLLNKNLEQIVDERTAKIKAQNDMLIKHSYTNAHDLRGPVARLLGLAQVYKLASEQDTRQFVDKMVDQAFEIDEVVKKINTDLGAQGTDNESET